MSIRFEKQPRKCTHLDKEVTLFVTFNTPEGLAADAELSWEVTATECLQRKTCGDACPGEDKVLEKL